MKTLLKESLQKRTEEHLLQRHRYAHVHFTLSRIHFDSEQILTAQISLFKNHEHFQSTNFEDLKMAQSQNVATERIERSPSNIEFPCEGVFNLCFEANLRFDDIASWPFLHILVKANPDKRDSSDNVYVGRLAMPFTSQKTKVPIFKIVNLRKYAALKKCFSGEVEGSEADRCEIFGKTMEEIFAYSSDYESLSLQCRGFVTVDCEIVYQNILKGHIKY